MHAQRRCVLFWGAAFGVVVTACLFLDALSSTSAPSKRLPSSIEVEVPSQGDVLPPHQAAAPPSRETWKASVEAYPRFWSTSGLPAGREDISGSTDGYHVVHEVVPSIADYRPTHRRFSQRWHPLQDSGRAAPSLFCTSHNNDSTMRIQDFDRFTTTQPEHYVTLPDDLCPNAILLREFPHSPTSLIKPVPRPSRRALKKKLRESLNRKPEKEIHPSLPLYSLPTYFVPHLRLFHIFTESHANPTAPQLLGVHSPSSTGCLIACLELPCCTAFQLLPYGAQANTSDGSVHQGNAECRLYVARHDEPVDDAPEPIPGAPVMFLGARREFRPSLVDNGLRLVVTRGPGPLAVLDPATNSLKDYNLEVSLFGEFGKLQYIGVHGSLTGTVLFGQRTLHSFVMTMRDGVAFTTGAALGTHFEQAAGHTICILVRMNDERSLGVVVPRPARSCSMVGFPAARTALHYGIEHNSWYPIRSSATTSQPRSSLPLVSRGVDTCAPHLRSNECCIHGFWYRIEDHKGRRTVPSFEHDLYTHHDGFNSLSRAQQVTLTAAAEHRCIRIVDGLVSIVNASGEGGFPRLVVQVLCDVDSIAIGDTNGFPVVLETSSADAPLAHGAIPWDALRQCRRLASADNSDALRDAARSSPPPPLLLRPTAHPEAAVVAARVGISLRAHKGIDFLTLQLRCFATFANDTVIALHLSQQWKVQPSDALQLAMLNQTGHPRTLINPVVVRSSSWKATHIHASNFKLLLRGEGDYFVTHIVIWAANELLVRSGLCEYVRQYHMSDPHRMDPADGLAYTHSLHHARWWSQEEHALAHHDLWWWLPWDGVSGEIVFAGILNQRRRQAEARVPPNGAQPEQQAAAAANLLLPAREADPFLKFTTHQFFLEGTFFDRDVSEEFVFVTQETPLTEYCTTSGRYGDNEIFSYLTMRYRCGVTEGLVCGGRVSTMLWRDLYYFATAPTLEEIRCTPFAAPFGWKRLSRNSHDPVVDLVVKILQNTTRALEVRDGEEHCQRTWASMQREKRIIAMSFI